MGVHKKAEKIIKDFFKKAGFEVDFNIEEKPPIEEQQAPVLLVQLKTEEAPALIGQGGRTLIGLQQILSRILRKQIKEPLYLDLDINQYKESKEKYLQDMAKETADLAALEKKEKFLPPMSAFERRVVHLALSERADVATESVGEGEDRRVAVRPR